MKKLLPVALMIFATSASAYDSQAEFARLQAGYAAMEQTRILTQIQQDQQMAQHMQLIQAQEMQLQLQRMKQQQQQQYQSRFK